LTFPHTNSIGENIIIDFDLKSDIMVYTTMAAILISLFLSWSSVIIRQIQFIKKGQANDKV